MATWWDMPTELRDMVVYWFCMMIVNEFANLDNDDPIQFPHRIPGDNIKTPTCLSSFSSVLKTSRYFRETLTKTVKINKLPAVEILQSMQYQKVQQLVGEMHVRNVIQDHGPPHLDIFRKKAGPFWANPKVLNEVQTLPAILFFASDDDVLSLLPRLQPWLLRHGRPVTNSLENDGLSSCFKSGSLEIRGYSMEIASIGGVLD